MTIIEVIAPSRTLAIEKGARPAVKRPLLEWCERHAVIREIPAAAVSTFLHLPREPPYQQRQGPRPRIALSSLSTGDDRAGKVKMCRAEAFRGLR